MQDDSERLVACIPRLRRYARALMGERAGADDLVQDTVERGWLKLASWRRGSDMRAWLFGIMHNLHADRLRRPALATVALEDMPIVDAAGADADPLALRDMDAALAMLPAGQREVLLLVALEEMTYEQVADALDIPLGTVMSRLSRGRERLRLLLLGQVAATPSPATPLKVVK